MITKERINLIGSGNRGRGFTLIEILIVIAIIAILASVILVGLGPTQREGRDSRRISDLAEVQNALELYYNHCGWYPGGGSGDCGAWSATGGESGGAAAYTAMVAEVEATTEIGITQLPVDPTNSGNLVYQYESVTPNSYTLAATLEDTGNAVMKSDESTDPNGGTFTGCGTTLYCVSL